MTTWREAVEQAREILQAAGVDTPAQDARLILAHVLGLRLHDIVGEAEIEVPAPDLARFQQAIAARAKRQPVSQIIGRRAFWEHEFIVTPDVLDPRPETEQLVEKALDGPAPGRFLDLGTGSGCIAVSLLAAWPQALGVATDISREALTVAAQNAERVGVADRLELLQSDWFAQVDGRFDLILCNPPYIAESEMAGLQPEVREWEPHLALTPGGDRVLFEAGVSQIPALTSLCQSNGFDTLEVYTDLTGRARGIQLQS